MSVEVTIFKVLVASPSDLIEERAIVVKVIQKWNTLHGFEEKTMLLPMMWEKNSAPLLGKDPQEIINTQFAASCDIGIALFWTQLGTPTSDYLSGTVEEVEKLLQRNKIVMAYFSDKAISPSLFDSSAYKLVSSYKEKLFKRGLVGSFTTIDEFESNLYSNLVTNIKNIPIHRAEEKEMFGDHVQLHIVDFDGENGIVFSRDTWKNIPLSQVQRNALLAVLKEGTCNPSFLGHMFGSLSIRELIDIGMLCRRNGGVELRDPEVVKFVSRYC